MRDAGSYTELHCHSGFSFLDGASSPDDLAAAAATQGYEALALTDHDGVWGAMEFAVACKPLGVRPIVGAEVTVALPVPGTVRAPAHARHAQSASRSLWHLCLLPPMHAPGRVRASRAGGTSAFLSHRERTPTPVGR